MIIKKVILTITVSMIFLFMPFYAQAQQSWKEHKGRYFIVFYKQAPQAFIKTVAESAERYYHEIISNLGFPRETTWSWDNRAKIYIYDDVDDYIASSEQVHWSSGSALLFSKSIKTFPTDFGFFDTTLPHELGHIIFREYVGTGVDIPLWLDEGVAMYQEKAKRFGSHSIVRKAIQNKTFIPLKELSRIRLTADADQETINLFYAHAASVVYFLIEDQGRFRFASFCRYLKEGLSLNESLNKAYFRFKDINDLNHFWIRYLKK